MRMFIVLFPLLLYIMPSGINDILLYLILYFIFGLLLSKENEVFKNQMRSKRRFVSAFLINAVLSFLFYIKWSSSSVIMSISQKIHVNVSILVILISIALFVLSFPAVTKILEYIKYCFKNFEKTYIYSFLNNSISLRGKIAFTTILVALFWILQGKLPIYNDIDNCQNSMILNGLFSNDNYCNFVSPILAMIVRVIDSVIPSIDGYVFVMEISMLLAIWILFYTLLSVCQRKINVIVIWTIFVGINFNLNVLHSNFTIYSAVMTCIGFVVLFACVKKKIELVFGILGLFVIFIGGIFRLESQLLFIPFVLLITVFELIVKKRNALNYLKRAIPLLLIAVICIGGNFSVNKIVSSSDKYSNAVAFSNSRSALFDYDTKSYDEVSDELRKINVSENDYNAVKKSFLADTDIITEEYLSDIHDVVKLDKSTNSMNVFLSTFYSLLFSNQTVTVEFLGFIAFIIFLLLFTNINSLRVIELILSMFGSIVIAIYFYVFVGRMPWYLLIAILLGNWLVLSSIFIFEKIQLSCRIKSKYIVCSILTLSVLFAFFSGVSATTVNDGKVFDCFSAKPMLNIDDSKNHDKYIWDTSSYNDYIKKNFWDTNTLTTSQFLYNNIPDRKSFYGQVYFNDFLNRINVKNPAKALLTDNVYYVSEKSNYNVMFTFLKEHYDADLKVKKVDEISGIPVWKFYS